MKQFAIFDNEGVQFGLPAREFPSLEAAQSTLDFLLQRREEMKAESQAAARELAMATGWDNETAQREADLQAAIDRWQKEKDRTYSIKLREVTPWVPATT